LLRLYGTIAGASIAYAILYFVHINGILFAILLILITITAILKPAYSITKQRNLLRLYGTIAGASIAYAILYFVHINGILFAILLI
ncbi:FUSC family protein, partial [Chryseobacterium sp. CH1]|uniref:FUSC family protein n=1 Tax=Chryseobacterium sp. CH1 TaxID=713551 RepID=UPI001025CC9A